jgi:MatP C-terminal ribbon-helix-helix domain
MTQTIELPIEVYEKLENQAQVRGTTPSETVARMIEEIEAVHLSAVVKQMQAEGLFAEPPSVLPHVPLDFQPIQVQGKPLSEVIIEERC